MTIPRNQKGLCLWDLNVKEMGKVCARVPTSVAQRLGYFLLQKLKH